MITHETIHNVVRTRFKTQVATPRSLITQYDNAPLEPPTDSIWARLAVRVGERYRVDIAGQGKGRYRVPGTAIAQIFTPIESGDRDALQTADAIITAFTSVTESGVTFETAYVVPVGRGDDNKWWQINVVCPFTADDVR